MDANDDKTMLYINRCTQTDNLATKMGKRIIFKRQPKHTQGGYFKFRNAQVQRNPNIACRSMEKNKRSRKKVQN